MRVNDKWVHEYSTVAGWAPVIRELAQDLGEARAALREALDDDHVGGGLTTATIDKINALGITLETKVRHDLMNPGTCDRCGNPIDRPCSICPNHPAETKGEQG